jgi:SAM-dependent methyltransferase
MSQEASTFAKIDQLPPHITALLIGALEDMAAHPEMRRVREVAWRALAPEPGQRLLDAGCGVGEVARELAKAGAEVVAIDFSAANVAAATQRHDGSTVTYAAGDVMNLEFPDDSFDGVRTERVLQHLADPDRAIAELIRVTRPGGRVCLIDTDWESVAVDGLPEALVGQLRAHLMNRPMMHHRTVGRTLRGRLLRAGLTDVTASPVVLYFDQPASAAPILGFVNPDVPREAGMVPDELREPWFAAVAEAQERGDFLAVLTMWVAAGTVPG